MAQFVPCRLQNCAPAAAGALVAERRRRSRPREPRLEMAALALAGMQFFRNISGGGEPPPPPPPPSQQPSGSADDSLLARAVAIIPASRLPRVAAGAATSTTRAIAAS